MKQHSVDTMGILGHSKSSKKPNDLMKLFTMAFLGIVCGFSLGLNLPMRRSATLNHLEDIVPDQKVIEIDRGSSATELKLNNTQNVCCRSVVSLPKDESMCLCKQQIASLHKLSIL